MQGDKYDKYLSDESDKLPEVWCLFIRVCMKDLANTVIMVPLLEKFLLVCRWVSLDKILKLREIRREQYTTTHGV